MAGTLVRQEVIGSKEVKALMKAMRWDEAQAIGTLVLLWNGSQNRKMTRASGKLIIEWCGVRPSQQDKILEVLASETCGFIKHVRGRLGTFEIVGNKKQVKKLKQLSALRSAGGKTTREKFQPPQPENGSANAKNGKQNSKQKQGLDAEVNKDPIPRTSLPRTSLPCTSLPRTSTEHDTNQESLALGGSGTEAAAGGDEERSTIEQALARAEERGDQVVAKQLRALRAKLAGIEPAEASA
jgi:hypothetical protein